MKIYLKLMIVMAFSLTLNKPRIHALSVITLIMFACMPQANSDIQSVFDYYKTSGGSRDFEKPER